MPSLRALCPGLLVILAACASSKRARPPEPTGAPETAARPSSPAEAAQAFSAPSPRPAAPPVDVPRSAMPIPVAPSAPAAPAPETETGVPRPAAPAAALPGVGASPPPPPPSIPTVAPSVPRTASAGAPAPWPATLTEFLAELRRRARSGAEPELAPVADLLDEIAAVAPTTGTEIAITRLPQVEAAEKERFGRGTGWCTLSHFLEPGADATAMRASYLDIDRVHEYTGKPGASLVRREGNVTIGRTDAIRKILALEFGARWTFRATSLDRGPARLVVSSMEPAADTLHMLATRGVILAFPARDGLFVAEANASLVDFEVPAMLKAPAESLARKEMLARVGGVRAHWREYAK